MPTSLSNLSTNRQKSFSLTILFLFTPLFFFGQSLTGLWIGSLSNDSTTVRKDQSFEIALTEFNGKVSGYSRSEFIVDDTLYYIVKRVKGTIKGDVCQVEDDEIIAFNFLGKLDKGVKLTSTFRRNHNDTSWYLAGTWKTNATKKYYAVTGKINLEGEKDLTASKIFPHLEELNLANDVAFYKERIEGPVIVKLAKPERIKTEYSTKPATLVSQSTTSPLPSNTEIARAESIAPVEITEGIARQETELPKTDLKTIPGSTVNINPHQVDRKIAEVPVPEEITEGITKQQTNLPKTDVKTIPGSTVKLNPTETNKKIAENKVPVQTSVAINKPVINNNTQQEKTTVTTNNKKPEQSSGVPTRPVSEKPTEQSSVGPNATAATNKIQPLVVSLKAEGAPKIDLVKQAAVVSGRKSEFSQMVNFKSDSLEFSLYDNGEIDGDTVSVYMNGQVILAKQGLKASAIKKTIYLAPDQTEFTLVLFAENLGKYPPNTGLLVVHDGEDVYNLRFSSDLQKNAGILFKRK